VKIVLLVEGMTEKLGVPSFLKRWLDARCKQRTGLAAFKFGGVGDYLNEYGRVAERFLDDPNCLGVIGLLDWYGFPRNDANVEEARARLQASVSHSRFRQHFAVHETEAWLLSDLRLFPKAVSPLLPKNDPEKINLRHPPSKALETAYRRALKNKPYDKIKGARLFTELDPDLAAGRCPHLKLLLDDLLELASCPTA
jgi:hypothetical protein